MELELAKEAIETQLASEVLAGKDDVMGWLERTWTVVWGAFLIASALFLFLEIMDVLSMHRTQTIDCWDAERGNGRRVIYRGNLGFSQYERWEERK